MRKIRSRLFVVFDANRFEPLSEARYKRLLGGKATFAGWEEDRISIAWVDVEERRGQPTLRVRVTYRRLPLTDDKSIDRRKMQREVATLVQSPLDHPAFGEGAENTADDRLVPRQAFERRLVMRDTAFLPSPEVHRQIVRSAILSVRQRQRFRQ